MSLLAIGAAVRAGRAAFTLPLHVATQAMAVHGVRGKGKTVTATVITEELLEQGIQVVVIDPTDCWFGLQSSATGKGAGYPVVVLGGPHGDLPLDHEAGRVIADFVVDHGASVVLSLRHLRKNQQREFVTDFAEQLYHRKGEVANRRPLFLVIDEASQYCPQRVMGDNARMVGAIQDMVRLGRHAGLGVALVDQRPASVNKDVLTQIEILVCHAVTSPQDRKALDDWIRQKDSSGHRDEFLEQLASLPRGEAWFWFPIADVFERVRVRMRRTFDSSKTPEIGEAPAVPRTRAEIDLDQLRAALEETIAEAEANDPQALRERIAELERELRAAQRTQGLSPEEAEQIAAARAAAAIQALRTEVRPHVEALHHALANGAGEYSGNIPGEDLHTPTPVTPARRPAPAPVARAAPKRREPRASTEPTSDLAKGERIILTAVAQHDAGVTREQLSVLTAYKRSSRDTYLQKLRAGGLVEQVGDVIRATDRGVRELGDDFEALPTGDELQEYWLGKLSGGEREILRIVCGAYPNSIDRDLISNETGLKRSSRDTYLQRLAARKLVHFPDRGVVMASEELFG